MNPPPAIALGPLRASWHGPLLALVGCAALNLLSSCGAADDSANRSPSSDSSGPTFSNPSVREMNSGPVEPGTPGSDATGSPSASSPSGDAESTPEGEAVYSVEDFEAVDNFDRDPGMPIGQDGPTDTEGSDTAAVLDPAQTEPTSQTATNEDLDIPTFTLEDQPPPCTDCLQLSVLLDSPNQQAFFSFNAGGQATTRVVWNLLIPANEDQIFLRTRVNGTDGPYEQLLANDFPTVGQPFEYVHRQGGGPWSGNANEVGLVLGSSGGWARNERVSVYVQSVVLEGSDGSSDRHAGNEFDGLLPRSTEQQPRAQPIR